MLGHVIPARQIPFYMYVWMDGWMEMQDYVRECESV